MTVLQNDNGEKGYFYIHHEGKIAAKMTYVRAGNARIIIDHTEVEPILAGKGAGKLMVTSAVEYVRANNIKILPLCPFAKSVFDKVKEFNDVL